MVDSSPQLADQLCNLCQNNTIYTSNDLPTDTRHFMRQPATNCKKSCVYSVLKLDGEQEENYHNLTSP